MTYAQLLYEVRDKVATITFNRPDRMNAWTTVLEQELRQAVDAAVSDSEVRAIVLTGTGKAFCAGADMSRLSSLADNRDAPVVASPASDDDLGQKYTYLLGVPKPLIAALNGAAAGVGLCIALYCDMRFMASGAVLTTSYARRGVVAEYGVAWMLPRLVGPMHAADLLFSARKVSTEEAATMGLVNMLATDDFRSRVHARAVEIAACCSPRSVGIMKRQMRVGMRQTLAEACQLADAEMALAIQSEDFREGVAHFVEKRAARFRGN